MAAQCLNTTTNKNPCACTYSGCPRHGLCCQCMKYHREKQQLPACCFPPEVEKAYDRSFACFIKTWS